MTKEEIIEHSKRIIHTAKENPFGTLIQGREFLRTYAGERNSFYIGILNIKDSGSAGYKAASIVQIFSAFIAFVENNLLRSISLEREIQIDTVSDYLEQAQNLLSNNKVHPAAAAVIIGASLEEFLRNWLEEIGTDLSEIKNSLDSYAKELKQKEKLTKQDVKDITSWGGTRNDAAHGLWENVKDRKQIEIMLAGVNLFMRKYSEN